MTVEAATALAHRIGRETAAVHAADVDVQARFPKETVDAFRAEGLLGALVPTELGGLGHDLRTAAAVVRVVGRYCASSAMILAMHHIQVACLVRHGRSDALRDYARRVAAEQLLLASATTEIGIGGNTRNSTCFVERDGAAVHADQAGAGHLLRPVRRRDLHHRPPRRRQPAQRPGPRGLRAARGHASTPLSGWDTLGFRGTCSLGFTLEATGDAALILDDPFGDISAQTMLPTAHLLWSSLWLGLAEEASWRAQRFVQKAARKAPGTVPPGATRLAALMVTRQEFAAAVDSLMTRYLSIMDDPEETSAVDFMVAINTLKISASTEVVDVVNQALLICGIQGYREDSEYSLGRILRDAHGAAVMVNNDRIAGNTAQLALMQREF